MSEDTKYIAHARKDEGGHWNTHDLREHLAGTATLAEMFAQEFGNGDWAKVAALWHDLGKFMAEWQES